MKQLIRPADLCKAPADTPEIVDVAPMQFVMVDGTGSPNTSVQYRQAIEALYGASYGLKFMLKKELGLDFRVSPLESLWWAPDMKVFAAGAKQDWLWTAMIMQPEEVSQQAFDRVRNDLQHKRPSPAVGNMRLQHFHEGTAAQIMHIGPYAAEGPTIERLHAFIRDRGYTFDGRRQKHHEIYLGDPRRARPDRLRTIIRQPFVGKRPSIPGVNQEEDSMNRRESGERTPGLPASTETAIYILMLLALASAIAGLWLGPLTNVPLVLAVLVAGILVWRTTIAHKRIRIALLVLEAFLVSSTLAGGVGILRGDFGLPASWLSGTAFSDYAVPGVMLLVVCAISMLAIATLFAERELAVLASVLAGVFMAGYELVESACIDAKVGSSLPIVLAAQILWFAAGVAVSMLAGSISVQDYRSEQFHVRRLSTRPSS